MNEENDKKPGEILYRKAMKYYILLCLIGLGLNLTVEVLPDLDFIKNFTGFINVTIIAVGLTLTLLWYF